MSKFIQRKVTGYRRQFGLSCLSSDSEPYIVDCTYLICWGLIRWKRSHKVSVPDIHALEYRKHWDRLIAEEAA
jgi:hypothetical protein